MKLRLLSLVAAVALLVAAVCPLSASARETVLTVGATPVPHAEILEIVKNELASEGITLKIIEYTDYVQPNLALDMGDLDANFFQHLPYLGDFNRENGTKLVSAVDVHFEPLGLYGGKTKSLSEIPDGASIAVPNDTTNEARALLLVESLGLIELPPDSGLSITPRDIVSNPKNLEFKEIEAAQIPNFLADVDFGVINGNYALSAGLGSSDMLASEDASSTAAITYANAVAIREGDKQRPEIQALVKAITSQAVADFIVEKYEGAVVPMFGGETPNLDAICERGSVIIGVQGDNAPYAYIDENGNNAGYLVEYGRRIALDLLDAEDVQFIAIEGAIGELLESGEADIILAQITDENKEQADFAFPLMETGEGDIYAAAVKKGNSDTLGWLSKQIMALEAEDFTAAFEAGE